MLISPWPIMFAYLLISIAELLLSPIGLSAVTQLASEKVVSMMMGLFLVTLGIGGFLAGKLAEFAAIKNTAAPLIEIKAQYISAFGTLVTILVGVLFIACILCLVIKQLSKRIERA